MPPKRSWPISAESKVLKKLSLPRLIAMVGSVFQVAALVFLAGPRVEIDTNVHHPTLPKNLEVYLANQESWLLPWT